MLRRIAFALLLLLGTAAGVRAQSTGGNVGNTVLVRFTGAPSGACLPNQEAINNATTDFYVCNSSNVWIKVGSSGGGGASPATPTGSVQYNAGGGSFGAIPLITAGNSDCDGFMSPCTFQYLPAGVFNYLFYGTDSMGTMGNVFDFYYDGGLFANANTDGVTSAQWGLSSTDAYFTIFPAAGEMGLDIKPDFKSNAISRYLLWTHTAQTPVAGDFVLSSGWGSTGAVSTVRGNDNVWDITVTPGGTGIAATPTIAFTFHNGPFGNTTNGWAGTCQMHGGTGTITDITWAPETNVGVTLTFQGLPVSGLTYFISCNGAVSGDN